MTGVSWAVHAEVTPTTETSYSVRTYGADYKPTNRYLLVSIKAMRDTRAQKNFKVVQLQNCVLNGNKELCTKIGHKDWDRIKEIKHYQDIFCKENPTATLCNSTFDHLYWGLAKAVTGVTMPMKPIHVEEYTGPGERGDQNKALILKKDSIDSILSDMQKLSAMAEASKTYQAQILSNEELDQLLEH